MSVASYIMKPPHPLRIKCLELLLNAGGKGSNKDFVEVLKLLLEGRKDDSMRNLSVQMAHLLLRAGVPGMKSETTEEVTKDIRLLGQLGQLFVRQNDIIAVDLLLQSGLCDHALIKQMRDICAESAKEMWEEKSLGIWSSIRSSTRFLGLDDEGKRLEEERRKEHDAFMFALLLSNAGQDEHGDVCEELAKLEVNHTRFCARTMGGGSKLDSQEEDTIIARSILSGPETVRVYRQEPAAGVRVCKNGGRKHDRAPAGARGRSQLCAK